MARRNKDQGYYKELVVGGYADYQQKLMPLADELPKKLKSGSPGDLSNVSLIHRMIQPHELRDLAPEAVFVKLYKVLNLVQAVLHEILPYIRDEDYVWVAAKRNTVEAYANVVHLFLAYLSINPSDQQVQAVRQMATGIGSINTASYEGAFSDDRQVDVGVRRLVKAFMR